MRGNTVVRWVLLPLLASGAAHAQAVPTDADIERAKELFAEARRLVNSGNCGDAVRKLEESLRFNESIGVRLSLAECARDRPLEAWRQLKMAEFLAAKKGDDRVTFARMQAAALEPRLALIRFELAPSVGDLADFEMHID